MALQPAPVQKIMMLQEGAEKGNLHPLWREWFTRLGTALQTGTIINQSAWSFSNAAARPNTGIINYQTQNILRQNTYSAGTVTIGTGNTGLYLVAGGAEVGYNGGIGGANATLEIFLNGAGTGYKATWTENNNTVEHGVISVMGLVPSSSGSDTIAIRFSTSVGGNVFAGSGFFLGRYVGT
jgi:hypothetical protein